MREKPIPFRPQKIDKARCRAANYGGHLQCNRKARAGSEWCGFHAPETEEQKDRHLCVQREYAQAQRERANAEANKARARREAHQRAADARELSNRLAVRKLTMERYWKPCADELGQMSVDCDNTDACQVIARHAQRIVAKERSGEP